MEEPSYDDPKKVQVFCFVFVFRVDSGLAVRLQTFWLVSENRFRRLYSRDWLLIYSEGSVLGL